MGHLVQPLCQSRLTYTRLHGTSSRQIWKISREGDSTTPLGSLFQCSVTLRVKKFFLMFSWNFLCFGLRPLPLVLSLGTEIHFRKTKLEKKERTMKKFPFSCHCNKGGWMKRRGKEGLLLCFFIRKKKTTIKTLKSWKWNVHGLLCIGTACRHHQGSSSSCQGSF